MSYIYWVENKAPVSCVLLSMFIQVMNVSALGHKARYTTLDKLAGLGDAVGGALIVCTKMLICH